MKQLTRDQAAVWGVNTSFTHFRPVVEDVGIPEVTKSFDLFESAVCNFVLSELAYRQAGRCKSLNVFPELGAHAQAQGTQKNAAGIENLKQALALLKSAADGMDKTSISKGAKIPFDPKGSILLFKEQISHLEIKVSDAEELGKVVDTIFGSDLKKLDSLSDLVTRLSEQLGNLSAIRARSDRGAETNIAVWKVVAAGALIGLAAWIIYKCYYTPKQCSAAWKASYNSALALAIILYAACE